MARLISEATEALSHLDAAALEELGRRAEALPLLDLGGAGVSSRALVPVLEHRFRLFAALLKATGDNLATLRRAESKDTFADSTLKNSTFPTSGYANREILLPEGYGPGSRLPPRGLFESLGLYNEEDATDSIWPRGRLAQARARRRASTPEPVDDLDPGRP